MRDRMPAPWPTSPRDCTPDLDPPCANCARVQHHVPPLPTGTWAQGALSVPIAAAVNTQGRIPAPRGSGSECGQGRASSQLRTSGATQRPRAGTDRARREAGPGVLLGTRARGALLHVPPSCGHCAPTPLVSPLDPKVLEGGRKKISKLEGYCWAGAKVRTQEVSFRGHLSPGGFVHRMGWAMTCARFWTLSSAWEGLALIPAPPPNVFHVVWRKTGEG